MFKKPTKKQHAAHLRKGIVEQNCLVCGNALTDIIGTDFMGQVKCVNCGLTYQVTGSRHPQEWLDEYGLKKEEVALWFCDCFSFLPIHKAYWDETHRPLPIGQFHGDPPYTQKDMVDYYKWMHKHRAEIEPAYKGDINWELVEEIANQEEGPETLIDSSTTVRG